jgi:hypothetical protein
VERSVCMGAPSNTFTAPPSLKMDKEALRDGYLMVRLRVHLR